MAYDKALLLVSGDPKNVERCVSDIDEDSIPVLEALSRQAEDDDEYEALLNAAIAKV